jgi:hypothetical protein
VAWMALLASVTISFITLPVIGLYFSLWRLNDLVSWLAACVVGLFIPWMFIEYGDWALQWLRVFGVRPEVLIPMRDLPFLGLSAALVWQLVAATFAAFLLHWNLSRRRFAMT